MANFGNASILKALGQLSLPKTSVTIMISMMTCSTKIMTKNVPVVIKRAFHPDHNQVDQEDRDFFILTFLPAIRSVEQISLLCSLLIVLADSWEGNQLIIGLTIICPMPPPTSSSPPIHDAGKLVPRTILAWGTGCNCGATHSQRLPSWAMPSYGRFVSSFLLLS